ADRKADRHVAQRKAHLFVVAAEATGEPGEEEIVHRATEPLARVLQLVERELDHVEPPCEAPAREHRRSRDGRTAEQARGRGEVLGGGRGIDGRLAGERGRAAERAERVRGKADRALPERLEREADRRRRSARLPRRQLATLALVAGRAR